MEEPTFRSLSPTHAIAAWRNVAVLIWRGAAEVHAAEAFRSTALSLARKHPNGIAGIHVIEPTAPILDAKVRAIMAEMAESLHGTPSFAAFVAEGHGLRSTVTRSIATGITLLMRKRSGYFRVFASVTEAAPWIADELAHMKVSVTPRQIVSAVEAVRAQLSAA